jgi:DNA/RNA endonuclease G (NUC1)
MATFVMPNTPIPNELPLSQFRMKEQVVERASGVQLWAKIRNEGVEDLCQWTECAIMKEFIERQQARKKNA